MIGTLILIVFICFCGAAILGLILGRIQGNRQKEQTVALQAIPDFRPAVKFDGASGGPAIAIDPASNKFAIINRTQTKVFNFSDLVAVEVLRNGSSVTKTNRGSQVAGAAVGAVLLGPVGLLLGGLTGSKRNVEKVERLSLKIFTNDLISPTHEIVFFGGPKAKPDSPVVKQGAQLLDDWHGRFQTILHMRAAAPAFSQSQIPSVEI